MEDRLPLYPGRVRMNPVTGQPNVFDMVREDSPQKVGTPLNKASLLSDSVAEAMGLPLTATPNDALLRLTQSIAALQTQTVLLKETDTYTVKVAARLRITAIGRGGYSSTGTAATNGGQSGGGGGGVSVDARQYKKGDIITVTVDANGNVSVACGARGTAMSADVGGQNAGETTPGVGGAASGGNMANHKGGGGGRGHHSYQSTITCLSEKGGDCAAGGKGGGRGYAAATSSSYKAFSGGGGGGSFSGGNGGSASYEATGASPGAGGNTETGAAGGEGGSSYVNSWGNDTPRLLATASDGISGGVPVEAYSGINLGGGQGGWARCNGSIEKNPAPGIAGVIIEADI